MFTVVLMAVKMNQYRVKAGYVISITEDYKDSATPCKLDLTHLRGMQEKEMSLIPLRFLNLEFFAIKTDILQTSTENHSRGIEVKTLLLTEDAMFTATIFGICKF